MSNSTFSFASSFHYRSPTWCIAYKLIMSGEYILFSEHTGIYCLYSHYKAFRYPYLRFVQVKYKYWVRSDIILRLSL